MQNSPLASCQIIPQQVSIAIEGGVHIDGLFLAAVVLMLVLIRMRRSVAGVVLVRGRPLMRCSALLWKWRLAAGKLVSC